MFNLRDMFRKRGETAAPFAGTFGTPSAAPAATSVPTDFVVGTVPPGRRIYAVGDIHGRFDLFEALLARIDADTAARPIEHTTLVLLGDYVDRGPRSADVVDLILQLRRERDVVTLAGNHEEFMLRSLHDANAMSDWLRYGGREALMSYGVSVPMNPSRSDLAQAVRRAARAVPPEHVEFLENLPIRFVCGTYAFVHAGVRPNVPLEQQTRDDLMWIRGGFISYEGPHDHVVVHGHTPVADVELLRNRINVDTGAYISGVLSCVVLEGTSAAVL